MYQNIEWYGNESYVIATDARNNTPVSVVTYVSNAIEFVHVFCTLSSLNDEQQEYFRHALTILPDIEASNTLRQRTSRNVPGDYWRDGPLEQANLTAYDADRVAMQACWTGLDEKTAMRLWYASSNTTLEEYLWVEDSNSDS